MDSPDKAALKFLTDQLGKKTPVKAPIPKGQTKVNNQQP
jgi:hypothetical protein